MIYNLNFFLILIEIILFKNFKGRIAVHIHGIHHSNQVCENSREKKRELSFLIITFVQLASVACLRGDAVGVDTKTYLSFYHYIYKIYLLELL